jgi:hypothetical protein
MSKVLSAKKGVKMKKANKPKVGGKKPSAGGRGGAGNAWAQYAGT